MLPVELREQLNEAAHRVAFGPVGRDGRPWVLFGSAVLLLHGLRRRIGDVDVFADVAVWTMLLNSAGWVRRQPVPEDPPFLEREFDGVCAHVFFAWTGRDPEVDARQCLRAAEVVDGWPCTPLQIVRVHKAMSLPKLGGDPRAQKHHIDVAVIDRHFTADSPCSSAPTLRCGSPLYCLALGCQL